MIAAGHARKGGAKLLLIDKKGGLHHGAAAELATLLHPGDLVIANDAATLPASLEGIHRASGAAIEVRLAGRNSWDDVGRFTAIVFGGGDFHTRTEDRVAPPELRTGDRLDLGPLTAFVERTHDHPRLIDLRFNGSSSEIWTGIARHGRPIQYAHVPEPLALWDVWSKVAGAPVAFEPPSAGFALDWSALASFGLRGIGFATLTHAAGISSTGDPELDRRLPFDELYRIPETTARAIERTRDAGGRVVAIGTTVVRALEHAGCNGRVHAGLGVATGRLGVATRLRVVDAILSGVHAAGESHYEILRAFADDAVLERATAILEAQNFRSHEFGDFVLVERKVSEAARLENGLRQQRSERGAMAAV